jgi:hypothetical protein
MKNTSSFVTTLEPDRVARRPGKTGQKGKLIPMDADAQRALAWVARGKPQSEIVHDDTVPKQSHADLAQFQRVSYRRIKPS